MSKIQFNELNTSELEVLNNEATAEVVGGYGYWGGYYYSKHVSKYSYSEKIAAVQQSNYNTNAQAALGGGKYSNTSNYNNTNQNNNANIYQ